MLRSNIVIGGGNSLV